MSHLLPYDVYYENSGGERLVLSELPFILTSGQLFNAKWKFSTVQRPLGEGARLLAARHSSEEKNMTVKVVADTACRLSEMLRYMSDVFDYDIAELKPGKLWINEQYMTCWCSARQKELSCDFTATATVVISVLPEVPVWCSEHRYIMEKDSASDSEAKRYPYGYPYRYSSGTKTMTLKNTGWQECPMRIIFRGPAENPAVYINGAQIGVNVTLDTDEYAVIDQKDRSVYIVDASGEKSNRFNARIKNGLTFNGLPAGECTAYCDSEGEVEIVVIEQRSEPEWTLN